ncbi:hypothetical protein EPO05_04320 [Patescibacteria group bacterium]|nr:MAG: hypothetical protein EPO05_04320 [Patescibacteria group bacterium]
MQPNCSQITSALTEIQKLKVFFDALLVKGQTAPNTNTSLSLLNQAEAIQRELEIRLSNFREQIIPLEFRQLIAKEQTTLSQFFGQSVDVPESPKAVTRELFKFWESIGFELHYLPQAEMTLDKNFPGWLKKPGKWFYDQIQGNNIAKDSATLKGEWVLVDGRPKPTYQNGDQMYANDPLSPILTKLRKKKSLLKSERDIEDYRHKGSRFNVSNDELQSAPVKTALAELLRTTPGDLSLPRAIEWNVLGNLHHPEWGDTTTWEWFQDERKGGGRLSGGRSDVGGLSVVSSNSSGYRDGYLGFRPLVRFSK